MLTAPDWALAAAICVKTHTELIPFIEKYGLAIYSRKPRKNILARLLPVSFPSSFRRMSSLAMVQAPGRNRRNAHNAGSNSLCRRKRLMQLRYYAAEGNVS